MSSSLLPCSRVPGWPLARGGAWGGGSGFFSSPVVVDSILGMAGGGICTGATLTGVCAAGAETDRGAAGRETATAAGCGFEIDSTGGGGGGGGGGGLTISFPTVTGVGSAIRAGSAAVTLAASGAVWGETAGVACFVGGGTSAEEGSAARAVTGPPSAKTAPNTWSFPGGAGW